MRFPLALTVADLVVVAPRSRLSRTRSPADGGCPSSSPGREPRLGRPGLRFPSRHPRATTRTRKILAVASGSSSRPRPLRPPSTPVRLSRVLPTPTNAPRPPSPSLRLRSRHPTRPRPRIRPVQTILLHSPSSWRLRHQLLCSVVAQPLPRSRVSIAPGIVPLLIGQTNSKFRPCRPFRHLITRSRLCVAPRSSVSVARLCQILI